nr:HEAT repeat domain-containing protein [Candidatus Sigynarchaeota archaeon]
MVVTIINLRLRFTGALPSNAIKIVSLDQKATFDDLRKYLNDAYFFSTYYINCEFIFKSKLLSSQDTIGSIVEAGYNAKKHVLTVMTTGARFLLRMEPRISQPPFSDAQIASLVRALEKAQTPLREEAASLLGISGNAGRRVQPLIAVLRDPYCHLRALAAEALGKLGDRVAVDSLLGLLDDRNPDVIQAAIQALGMLGDTRACDLLAQKLRDPHYITKRAAASALARLRWEPKSLEEQVLLSVAQEEIEKRVPLADAGFQVLEKCFQEGDSQTRHAIIEYIAQQASPRGTSLLQQACKDPNPWVSEEARRALEKS